MLGVGLLLDILFGYVFHYLGYRTDSGSAINEGMSPERVLKILDGGPATLLLAGYIAAFAVAAGLLITRRDTV